MQNRGSVLGRMRSIQLTRAPLPCAQIIAHQLDGLRAHGRHVASYLDCMSRKNHHHSSGATQTAATLVGEDAISKAGEAREHLNEAVTAAKQACVAVKQTGMKRLQAADKTVRENPYRALGIAFGLGALLGLLLSRRRES